MIQRVMRTEPHPNPNPYPNPNPTLTRCSVIGSSCGGGMIVEGVYVTGPCIAIMGIVDPEGTKVCRRSRVLIPFHFFVHLLTYLLSYLLTCLPIRLPSTLACLLT